jgi:hypothetical protein
MKVFAMKNARWARLAAGLVALVFAATTHAAMQQGQAVVRAVRGTAEYSAGGAWAPLKVGTILYAGSTIKTGEDSQVDLFLKDNGPVVRVTANTILGVDKLTFDNTGVDTVIETQLDLKAGRIQGNVKKTSAASRYEVKTPTGVAGIRGTLYDISADGRVRVWEGSVVMVYVDPSGAVSTHVINAGQQFVPGVGVTPLTDPRPPLVSAPTGPVSAGGNIYSGPMAPGSPPGFGAPGSVLPPGPAGTTVIFVEPDIRGSTNAPPGL